ncbi:hypothetical protein FSP39_024636 [Pinctada imbricata]|uniref:C2H2-type domain-containing protein n=1 Tax=Pinctada imbricata TaxID=66713 RepID=A0AA88XKB5_PINIB|nr:hypothetical protein FSP39_024636 [Pinctada imbricata]
MSQLEDPPSSPESCDQSSMEPDSPFPMDTNDLNPEDLPGGIGVSQANPYGCQFCNQAFPRLRYLKIHEQIHIDQLPFRCEHCSRRFRHKRSLDRHVKLHNGEKKYKCGDCSAAFVRSDHLKVHQKTHGNLEEAFRCILCGKSFGSMALLTSHVVTHDMTTENIQRFNCSKCQGTFPTQSELNSHMMLHNMDMSTTQKAFHCTYCPEICLGPESLELHVQSKHTHRCKFCPHIAVSLDELSQHMKCHDHQQTGQNDVIMIDNNDRREICCDAGQGSPCLSLLLL